MDLVLRAERVLLEGEVRPAAVAVSDGRIVDVGAVDSDHLTVAEAVVPSNGVLMPGFVDTHVHINEPGTDWEGFATATAAAAAAGITTLVDMPLDSDPVTTSVAALEVKRAAAQDRCLVDVGFWAGVVPENIGALAALAGVGVAGFKCFLTGSGNPNFGPLSTEQLRQAMSAIADLESVLLVHAESQHVIDAGPRPRGRGYSEFLDSRPDAAEEDAVALILDVAAATGARAHIVHVSSATVLPLLAEAKKSGVFVSAETCPHYLTFAAESVPDGGTQFAACPPIRGSANRDALWQALVDGTLDMVVSDHSPCAPELKGDGDFGRAFGGISSLELGPRAVWTHADTRDFGLAELSGWMSERPAMLAGLTDRGRIAVGLRADLCVFDPDAMAVVDVHAVRHRHPVSPYDGVALRGRVLQTWVAGRPVLGEVCAPL
ncbi:allantoinase AllB [Mycolicibacterium stellerae]|uniref:allantoinase AllB n=1 Tax=Mycolicibacterium stellerae TaxID=2358193 RepID=UPI000F0B64BA|nr:allantoinase AllB [Mycolicibacterium stellerae]